MKHIHFFALKKDILPILEMAEHAYSLKYVRAGQFSDPKQNSFFNGNDIPNLGIANADSAINCESYLVVERDTHINMRVIKHVDGSERFSVDQLLNPDSVTFTAAGVWGDAVVLNGRVATTSDSEKSQKLMKLFSSAFRKRFKKVKAYWVGPNAQMLLEAGTRLTIAVQSPSHFDLAPE